MYNLSFCTSKFHNAWKQATFTPILKAGNLTMVQNYRPISLLPLPGEILEKLIKHQPSFFLKVYSLLDVKSAWVLQRSFYNSFSRLAY